MAPFLCGKWKGTFMDMKEPGFLPGVVLIV